MRPALLLALGFAAFAAERVPVTGLAFSPDGKLLVSGGYKELLLWDPSTGRLVRKIGKLSGQVRALAFGADSGSIAVADGVPGRAGSVTLVNLETGAITAIQQAKDEMLAVAFSPDGKYVATGGTDSIVRIYAPGTTSAPVELKGHSDWISSVAFSPDGKLFASGSADKTARVWKTDTWKEIFQLPMQITEPVSAVAFANEGDLLAFATGGPDERAIRIWRTQGAFTEIDSTRPGQRNGLMQTRPIDTGACLPLSVTFGKAQPHSRMIVGCSDKTVRFIAPGGNTIATGAGHADWVYTVASSPDGTRIASAGADGAVKIWSPAGKLLFTLIEGTTQP